MRIFWERRFWRTSMNECFRYLRIYYGLILQGRSEVMYQRVKLYSEVYLCSVRTLKTLRNIFLDVAKLLFKTSPLQTCIQNPIKYLRWSIFQKYLTAFSRYLFSQSASSKCKILRTPPVAASEFYSGGCVINVSMM